MDDPNASGAFQLLQGQGLLKDNLNVTTRQMGQVVCVSLPCGSIGSCPVAHFLNSVFFSFPRFARLSWSFVYLCGARLPTTF